MAVSVEWEAQRAGGKPPEAAKAPAERGKRGIFGDSLEGVEDVLFGLQGRAAAAAKPDDVRGRAGLAAAFAPMVELLSACGRGYQTLSLMGADPK